jgi:hypothetical protein
MWETIMVKVKLQLTHTKSLQEFSFLDLDDALYLVFSILYYFYFYGVYVLLRLWSAVRAD